MSDRMSDARAAALFERLRLMARGDSLLENSMEAIIEDWRRARESEARLSAALEKINAIRNSIIACQTVNWSEHVYPLVEALNGAGFAGKPWPADREHLGSVVQQRDAALTERDAKHEPPKWLCRRCGATGQTRADLAQSCSCPTGG